MTNTKRVEWARQQRLRTLAKRAALVGKPMAPPPAVVHEVIAKPVIVPAVEKGPGPAPAKRVDHRLPYTLKKGEYICEVCGYTLKTEKGIRLHIEAKHPEVEL